MPDPPFAAEAVLFDLDGVLADSFDVWLAVLAECRARRGLRPLEAGDVRAIWGQGIVADCETLFPGTDPRHLAREYADGFARHIERVRAMPGARETVAALAARGVPLALVTNSPRAMARRVLQALALDPAFEVVAAGDEVPRGKPDPALVRLALERLGVAPAAGVMVGDTPADLEAASRAGVPAVGFRLDGGDARVDRLPGLLDLIVPRDAPGESEEHVAPE